MLPFQLNHLDKKKQVIVFTEYVTDNQQETLHLLRSDSLAGIPDIQLYLKSYLICLCQYFCTINDSLNISLEYSTLLLHVLDFF